MKKLASLIICIVASCQAKKQSTLPHEDPVEIGLCGQAGGGLSILAPTLEEGERLDLETFKLNADMVWVEDESALTKQGWLKLSSERILIRDKSRSLAQIVDGKTALNRVILEEVLLPPLWKNVQRLFSQVQNR